LDNPGSVAGGGAIELIAEEGDIIISNELTNIDISKFSLKQ